MPLWNIKLPANAAMFFGFIMTIASFDLLPTDTFYNQYFASMAPTTAINENFQAIGFSSMYFNYNIGSMIISFLAFPVLALVSLIIKPLRRFKCCDWLYLQITGRIYWNSTIKTISSSYTVIVMCVCINTLNVSDQPLISLAYLRQPRGNHEFLPDNIFWSSRSSLPNCHVRLPLQELRQS
jgi:hypothetical protein